jgi:hypothetical protein
MISRAIERGVPCERIAVVLSFDQVTVRRRASLLEGICPEAAALLADKNCPRTTFAILKQMKPMRRLQASELIDGSRDHRGYRKIRRFRIEDVLGCPASRQA